ncbi:lipopolysaccharide transport periplasmic protein LptA [Plasticicumulans sp.]|uniref:lipopolysaccharide transport periplasmic protein LptA n=1 Tax=Plasticicumulans sp. TaxID=2307179 RepID=UPI003955300B
MRRLPRNLIAPSRITRGRITSGLIAPGLLACALSAQALPEDRQQPVNLVADRAEMNQQTGVATYEGNVIVTQGTMRLTGDKVVVYTQEGELQRMESFGKPTTFKQKPAADKEEILGESLKLEYDARTGIVIATGKAKITQVKDTFTGDRIEYDVNKDLVKARGGESAGRVQIILQPKPEGGTPVPGARPAQPAQPKKP